MSTKRSLNGEPNGRAKRSKKDKKHKKEKKSQLRLFKINKELYEALANKQHDLGTDGDDCLFGHIRSGANEKPHIVLSEEFLQEAKGLEANYLVDEVKRTDVRVGQKKKKKRKSCEISVKMFTKDVGDRRVLAADIGKEFNLKVPLKSKRFVKKPEQHLMTIVTTVMQQDHSSSGKNKRVIDTSGVVEVATVEDPDLPKNDEQTKGAIFKLFQQQYAWTAKELSTNLGIGTSQIKRHLKAMDAFYHQSGELASKWTIDIKYRKLEKASRN